MRAQQNKCQYLWVLIPLFLVFWLYNGILQANFNWEDAMLLGDAAKALTKGNWWYTFVPWWGAYARLFWQPVAVVFYGLFGYNATPFFALALFFHLANVILVYILALRLTSSRLIAIFSSTLYGVYQVNYEGLIWLLAGIKDIPMTMFFLVTLLMFSLFLDKKDKKFLIFSYCGYFFALTCEMKAVLIPIVLMIYELLIKEDGKLRFFLKLNQVKKYLPFLAIALFFVLIIFGKTADMFKGIKNPSFWLAFPASIIFYSFPINRVFWLKVYTNAWGFTRSMSDETYIEQLGLLIIFFLLIFLFVLLKRKSKIGQIKKFFVFLFLFLGVFLNYLPIILTVMSGYQSIWQTTTMNWRYYLLPSSLASIMVVTAFFWLNEELLQILKKINKKLKLYFLETPLRIQIIPTAILLTIIFLNINYVDSGLKNFFFKWSYAAKKIIFTIKMTYPSFPVNSVMVIEGTNNENEAPFFQHRYLFENLFAAYALPNNPNFLQEQKRLPLDPNEACYRTLKRLLYYTNLKDFLVGNHEHLYKEGDKVDWITLNLPWRLPALDRLFLGAIYGYYDPDKVFDFYIKADSSAVDMTGLRRKQLKEFLNYYCINNGIKNCMGQKRNINFLKEMKEVFKEFSPKGKEIINFLVNFPDRQLPKLEEIKI